MTEIIEIASKWFLSLGEEYGVNPIVFGTIYVGAIPFFTISVGWLIRNYRRNKSIFLPTMSTTFFFISAYLYLLVAGRNVPWWVYMLVCIMIVYGGYSTVRKIRDRIDNHENEDDIS